MAENIVTKYLLDVSEALTNMDRLDNRLASHESRLEKIATSNPFKEAAKGAGQLEQDLLASTKRVAELEAVVASYKEQVKQWTAEEQKLKKAIEEVNDAAKNDALKKELVDVQGQIKNVNEKLGETNTKVGGLRGLLQSAKGKWQELTAGANQSGTVMNRVLVGATRLAGGLAVAVGLATVAIYNARKRYMEMNDSLLAVSGNQANVTSNMEVLDGVASDLDISLRGVAGAFNLLNSNGLAPTKEQLKSIGTVAKEAKTDIVTLSDAIAKADKGQVDSLTKLGFQAQVQGNKVQVSFRGVTAEFKKGSGESVKALDEISKKIQLTENSTSGIGRVDFMDRLAKGFVDAEIAISQAAETTNKHAYPTFERFERLIDRSRVAILNWAESFGIWVSVGWEKIKADADLLLAGFVYFRDLWNTRSFDQANANMGRAWDAFLKNREIINEQERLAQSRVGQDQGGELKTSGGKLRPEDQEAIRAAKERKKELERIEKELQEGVKKLRDQYGKDKLESLKEDELAYLAKKKELSLQEVDVEQKKFLLLKQLASGARRGMFNSDNHAIPDTSVGLSTQEQGQFDFRRQLINDQEYLERAKFISESEREITKIISNEYQKQLQETEYKYEQLFEIARKSGVSMVKLEQQKQKEIAKINLDKSVSDLEAKQIQESTDAELNIIRAQIQGRSDLETQSRKGLLEIEKKYALAKIQLIEAAGGEEAAARVTALKKTIAEIDKNIADITLEEKKQPKVQKYLQEVLGMSDDNISEAIRSAQLFASKMTSITSELYSTLNRISEQRIQRINQEISAKEQQVKKEQDLNEEGVANNLSLRLKELNDLKAARERALDDQKRLQRTQLIVDTATQASSMITAAAKVYAGFAGIPIAGPALGAVAVAAMLAAFAVAKIKAFQLVNSQTPQFKHGGRHTGRLHSEGGELVEVERDEWTINRKSSMKYDKLLEAINDNNDRKVMDYLVHDLLANSGISFAEPMRRESVAFMKEHRAVVAELENLQLDELKAIRNELHEIKHGTNRIPKSQYFPVGDGKYAEVSPSSTVIREIPKE